MSLVDVDFQFISTEPIHLSVFGRNSIFKLTLQTEIFKPLFTSGIDSNYPIDDVGYKKL